MRVSVALVAPVALALSAMISTGAMAQWSYPSTPTSNDADIWYGKRYPDPYRPLEKLADPKIAAWFRAQAELTNQTLTQLPGRDALVREWLSMDTRTPPRYREFQFDGGRLFYRKTLGGENVGRLYVREGWDGPERLLFDPSSYKKGSNTALRMFAPSWDGKHVLLGLAAQGGE